MRKRETFLNTDVSDSVIATLRQIIRAIDLQSRNLAKSFGLTGPQIIILKTLAKRPNVMVGEIAREISLSQATVTTILDRLERKGMAEKRRDEADKRRVLVNITPKGMQILEQNPSILQEQFLREFGKLREWEQTQILSTLQRIAGMMRADDIEAAPHLISGVMSATAQEISEFFDREDNEEFTPAAKKEKT
jgi:DNA-binding MarR family transcriptional regulator